MSFDALFDANVFVASASVKTSIALAFLTDRTSSDIYTNSQYTIVQWYICMTIKRQNNGRVRIVLCCCRIRRLAEMRRTLSQEKQKQWGPRALLL